jgi:hypothetical protein
MLLAWLSLAYLACPDLAIDFKSQILSTCESGRYTSQARIIQIAQLMHTMIYIPLQVNSRGQLGSLLQTTVRNNNSQPFQKIFLSRHERRHRFLVQLWYGNIRPST